MSLELQSLSRRHTCQECGDLRVLTERGAYLCPNGHGRVTTGINQTQERIAKERIAFLRWAEQWPEATKELKGWSIVGHVGLWKRQSREVKRVHQDEGLADLTEFARTAKLLPGEELPPGCIAARDAEWKVWSFGRLVK